MPIGPLPDPDWPASRVFHDRGGRRSLFVLEPAAGERLSTRSAADPAVDQDRRLQAGMDMNVADSSEEHR